MKLIYSYIKKYVVSRDSSFAAMQQHVINVTDRCSHAVSIVPSPTAAKFTKQV
jgi:hypothetical protein